MARFQGSDLEPDAKGSFIEVGEQPMRLGVLGHSRRMSQIDVRHGALFYRNFTMKFAQRVRSLAFWERVGVRERSGARRHFIVRGGSARPMIVRGALLRPTAGLTAAPKSGRTARAQGFG